MMKYSEQFMEHIEYAFAAFCKIVLRNAAISTYRDLGRKQKHEVSLDYLMSTTILSSIFMKSRLFLLFKGKKLSLQVDG